MWLTVSTFVASFLCTTVKGEEEFLVNGLPLNCGTGAKPKTQTASLANGKVEAFEHGWPWHVGLYSTAVGPFPFCGGTLIAPTWVLTAGHCVISALECKPVPLGQPTPYEEYTGNIMAVRVADHNFTRRNSSAFSIVVKHFIIHPKFPLGGPKTGYDIALLKLEHTVKRSSHVGFACLPNSTQIPPPGQICYTAGWGLIPDPPNEPRDEQPKVLMEVKMPIATMSDCKKQFLSVNKDSHVCTDTKFGTPCLGDSGGGMHCSPEDQKWILYGIASFCAPKCIGRYYVFQLTGPVLEWIKDNIVAKN
ncbi:hypothetical protein SprV_0200606800 [Sparganum proliferum]